MTYNKDYAKQWRAARSEEQKQRDATSLKISSKIRADKLLAFKTGKPCMDCGHHFPAVCMDFDHRPGETKLFDISTNRLRRWDLILAEIEKCDLVCANCHRIRTHSRRKKT